MRKRIVDPEVKKAFDAYPPAVRKKLMQLRMLILSVAKQTEGVGALEETLKWGHPSYLTTESRSGSSIRIGREKKTKADFAMYFKCQTSLVAAYKARYGELFRYEGNRAILFNLQDTVPLAELGHCIAMALTYHSSKRSGRGQRDRPV